MKHQERKHSPYSASGAERWFECPGSIKLSEGIPDKDSVWSLEGTHAHEVLENFLRKWQGLDLLPVKSPLPAMRIHVEKAGAFILGIYGKAKGSRLVSETRVHLPFVHPEAFGTLDASVVEYFGTLHVIDFKYGAGVLVSAKENLQMIFYAMGVAHQHGWDFQRVRLWILQPRIGNGEPTFWDISIGELKAYVDVFKRAVERVEKEPDTFVEGKHCWFCKAKGVCPLKQDLKFKKAKEIFKPIRG